MAQKVEETIGIEQQSVASDESEAGGSAVRKDGPSGPKIRSRPIDINQPMVVMFPETDDEFDGYFVHPKGFASPERPKVLRGSQVNVPIPIVRILKDKATPGREKPFSRPKPYIRTPAALVNDENVKAVEYDLDEDDDRFLRALNELEVEKKRKPITEDEFEATIDFLEKESFFKGGESLPVIMSRCGKIILDERDIPCSVCWSPDTHEDNDILFCDGCNVAVHQNCYGIDVVPEGEWRCDKCRLTGNKSSSVKCFLCPHPDGAFRRHQNGLWYHVACSQQCPVSFEAATRPDPNGATSSQPVQRQLFSTPARDKKSSSKRRLSLNGIPEGRSAQFERQGAVCCLCDKTDGVCSVCREPGCECTFHVSCGHKNGLFFLSSQSCPESPERMEHGAYCRLHSLKPQYLQLRRLLFVPRSLTPVDVDQLVGTFTMSSRAPRLSSEAIQLIFRYWMMRRWSLGRSLIPRFELLNKDRETYEKLSETLTKNQSDYDKLVTLRQHLERVRILVDLSKKREILRRQVLDSLKESMDLVDATMRPKPSRPAPVGPNLGPNAKPRGRPKKRKEPNGPLSTSEAKRAKMVPADAAITPSVPRSPSSTASASEVYESSPVATLPPVVPSPVKKSRGPGRPRKSDPGNSNPKPKRKRKREEATVGTNGELLPPKPKKRKLQQQPVLPGVAPAASSLVVNKQAPSVDIKIEEETLPTLSVAPPTKKKAKRPRAKRAPMNAGDGSKLQSASMNGSVGPKLLDPTGISAPLVPSSTPTKVPQKKKNSMPATKVS